MEQKADGEQKETDMEVSEGVARDQQVLQRVFGWTAALLVIIAGAVVVAG